MSGFSVKRLDITIEAHFGHIDFLVSNAGCDIRKPADDVSWDRKKSLVSMCSTPEAMASRRTAIALGASAGGLQACIAT